MDVSWRNVITTSEMNTKIKNYLGHMADFVLERFQDEPLYG